jgi:membrane-bound lytic murein transglycosylase F
MSVKLADTPQKSYKSKKLIVAMDTKYHNYFLQKGTPCGYQLELFHLFSKYEDVDIEFCMVPDSVKLSMLSRGDIDLAVFSEGFDSLYSVFNRHKNICSSVPLDDSVKSVWLSSEKNIDLILSVNIWASKLKGENSYQIMHNKYFNRRYDISPDKISPYDYLLKKYSADIACDWRLIAAIVYHESKFRPGVVSRHGAAGLMQLMPQTARKFGVGNVYNPEENIRGGIKLIAYLTARFREMGVPDEESVYFVLAAYNAGQGRIENCMKVALALGLNPNKWSDVYSVIPLMKNPDAEIASVVGSKFNGKETMNFVNNVIKSYKHYQHFVEG